MSKLALTAQLQNKQEETVARNAAWLCGEAVAGVMSPEYADTIAGTLEIAARIQRDGDTTIGDQTAQVLDYFAATIRKRAGEL